MSNETKPTPEALALIKQARENIAEPNKWTQSAYGRDKHGNALGELRLDNAVCFCSIGALQYAAIQLGQVDNSYMTGSAYRVAMLNLNVVMNATKGLCIPDFNDSSTHAEVLAAFDRTIQFMEEQIKCSNS